MNPYPGYSLKNRVYLQAPTMKSSFKYSLITLSVATAGALAYFALPAHKESATSSKQPELAMHVYKTPTCGCCTAWVEHLERENFQVTFSNVENVAPLKLQRQIEQEYWSCHTGLTANGYAFEGHVPAKFIKQFLSNPNEQAIGLSVPAMPVGSPGMEYNNQFMPYQVLLLKKDGSSEVYAEVTSYDQQF